MNKSNPNPKKYKILATPNFNTKINPNINTNNNLQMQIQQIKVINQTKTQIPIQPQNNPILYQNKYPNNNPNIPQTTAINQAIIANNQSFHTAPIQRNVFQIPNMNQKINQNLFFNKSKRKTFNKVNKNENMRLSINDERDDDNNYYKNLEDYNKKGINHIVLKIY